MRHVPKLLYKPQRLACDKYELYPTEMTNADKLQFAIQANEINLPKFRERSDAINARIRGWSNANHYLFFKSWMDAFPEAKSVLIVGVYLGRDIAYMLDAAGDRPLNVTGIDKFNAEPCDDWPEEKRGMTWEQAFNCPPPDMEQAAKNYLTYAGPNAKVQLTKADSKDWLPSASGSYDLIFLDGSHEFASINREIRDAHKLCHPFTIVSGDDYANVQPGWGVEDAVKQSFKSHYHIDNRIWFSDSNEYL